MRETGEFQRHLYSEDDPNRLIDQDVEMIWQDSSNNYWMNTFDGVYLYNEKFKKLGYWKFPIGNNPVSRGSVVYVPNRPYLDSFGTYWYFLGNSIGCIAKRSFNFKAYSRAEPVDFKTKNIDTAKVICTSTIWDHSSLFMLYRSDHTYTELFVDPKKEIDQFGYSIMDRKGNLWVATRGSGLYKGMISANGSISFKQVFSIYRDSANIPGPDINKLFEDSKGRIWLEVAGYWPCFYDPELDRIIHLVNNPCSRDKLPETLPGVAKGSVQGETNSGILLAAHKTYGIFAIVPPLIRISENAVMPADLIRFWPESGNDVILGWEMYQSPDDSTGIIWSRLSNGQGGGFQKLTRVNPEQPCDFTVRSRIYKKEDGLSNNHVLGFVEDAQGNFWISTEDGLSRFDPLRESFVNFFKEDGLDDNLVDNQIKKSRDGELFFRTGGASFISFYPDSIMVNNHIPPVMITSLSINQVPVSPANNPLLDKSISYTSSIKLPYNKNNISLGYTALDYKEPFRNQYRYRLEGFDKEWIYAGNRTR